MSIQEGVGLATRAAYLTRETARLLLTHRGGKRLRLLRRLLAYGLLQGQAETITFRRDGTLWTGSVRDILISWALFARGGHQTEQLRSLLRWLGGHGYLAVEKTTIIDVGANIGTTSIPLAQCTRQRLIAVEPVPDNFALLQRNVEQNTLHSRICCVNAAITDRPGALQMVIDPRNSGSGEIWDATIPRGSGSVPDVSHVLDVSAMTLEALLAVHQLVPSEVSFVWSDTQGFERQVIESGKALWSAGVPLYVEFWPLGLKVHGGMDSFMASVRAHFGGVVLSEDLRNLGAIASPRPVTDLLALVNHLTGTHCTDVLLLPFGWDRAGSSPVASLAGQV